MDEQHVLDVANAHAGNDGGVAILFIVIAAVFFLAAYVLREHVTSIKPRRHLDDRNYYTDPKHSDDPGNIFYMK